MSDVPADSTEVFDNQKLLAEINAEVRRRRASGDFPPGLERELDALFARFAPHGSGANFDEVLERAEAASFVHAEVPTDSRKPGVAQVKLVQRKAFGWYMRFVAQQVTVFAGAITRAVRLLGDRVETLETATVKAGTRMLDELSGRGGGTDLLVWTDSVVAALRTTGGRVVHAECGTGAVVAALVEAGADAYGIEPAEALAVEATRAGLDVRADDIATHLRAIPAGSLGGIVLTGCVERFALGTLLALVDDALAALADDGTLIVVSATPEAFAAGDPVVADLSPGRPLHADTWAHVLSRAGLTCAVETRAGAYLVSATR